MATFQNPEATNFQTKRKLGRSGLMVSRLGFGSSYGAPAEAYEEGFKLGVNYFYWGSYRRDGMGQAIRNLAPQHRKDMVVALQSYSRWPWLLRRTFMSGLKKLKLDYADVLLLGWYNEMPPEAIMQEALELKANGLIKAIAISCHNRPQFKEFIDDKRFDIIMTRYNAAHRGAEREVFPHLQALPPAERPGVITYTTTRWGYLVDPEYTPDGVSTPKGSDCYRFALSNPNVDLVLCGPASLEEMREDVQAVTSPKLSHAMTDEELAWMRKVGDHVHARTSKKLFTNPFMQRKQ